MITPHELVFTVDENDNPVAPVLRSEAHQKGIWHRISHVWVVNSKRQILCQKRSLAKDNNPGKWEAFFGGHVAPGESYEEGAVKEANEELGLSFTMQDLHFFTKGKSEKAKHFQSAFYVVWDGLIEQLHLEKEEVAEVSWKDIKELEDILVNQKDPTWVHVLYEAEMLSTLNSL